MTRGPGRPPIGERIEVRLAAEDIDRLDAAAKAETMKRPEWLRYEIIKAIDRVERRHSR